MGDFTAHAELMNDVIQLDNSSINSADQREDAKSCDILFTVSSVPNLSYCRAFSSLKGITTREKQKWILKVKREERKCKQEYNLGKIF